MSGRLKASLVRMVNIHLRPLPQLHFIAFVVLGIGLHNQKWGMLEFLSLILPWVLANAGRSRCYNNIVVVPVWKLNRLKWTKINRRQKYFPKKGSVWDQVDWGVWSTVKEVPLNILIKIWSKYTAVISKYESNSLLVFMVNQTNYDILVQYNFFSDNDH